MKADLALHHSPYRLSTRRHVVFAGVTLISAILLSGCYGPAKGPTDPKDFIVQGKQWTAPPPSNAPSIDPSATVPTP